MQLRLPLRYHQRARQTRRVATTPVVFQGLQTEGRWRCWYAGLLLLLGLILGSGDSGWSLENGVAHSRRGRLLSVAATTEGGIQEQRRERAPHGDKAGPAFLQEPPSRVVYLNTTGAWIHCQAFGDPVPTVRWRHVAYGHSAAGGVSLLHAGTLEKPLEEVAGVRRLLPNGTLHMAPFSAAQARHHAGVVQCVAQNDAGSIVSREVHLRGVVAQEYKTKVYDEFVVRGNTAVLQCQMPSFVREDVEVTGWLREDGFFIQPGVYETNASLRHRVVSPSGELLVRNVSSADDGVSYRCQTRHKLTGSVKESDTSGRIIVNLSTGPFQPRHIFTRSALSVDEGSTAELVCVAHGYSVPEYRWYKLSGGRVDRHEPIPNKGGRVEAQSDTLLIHRCSTSDSGRYLCVANNTLASEPFTVTLNVHAPLSAVVQPEWQTVDLGGTATFNCIPSGNPVSTMVWIKDGKALRPGDAGVQVSPDGRSLMVQSVSREDAGIYQCLVRNERDSAQGTAWLKLGFSAPSFLSVFSEQSTNTGRRISLQCSATGSPLPRISWALDGASLPEAKALVALPGHVSSFINISAVRLEHGGLYSCRASNAAGMVEHAARLNVLGPPLVRPMAPISAVAGESLRLDCHYSGYPVEGISWTRGFIKLPSSKRQEVQRDGSLVISEVRQYEDNGTYTCHVTGPQGKSANGSVQVNVRVRPTIAPFSFPSGLQAGMRARLGCTVISGDPPFEFGWRKDEMPLDAELGVRAQTDAFSSDLTFTSLSIRHNGNYTCVVTNAAATASHSALLVVQVPPQWVIEPTDASVLLGHSVRMDCWADGYPLPTVTWERETYLYGTPGFITITAGTDYEIYANGSLLVKNAQEQSAGRYICQATNGIRSGLSKLVHLKVHAGPSFASKFRSEAVRRGDVAHLHCKVQGDPTIALTWAKDGEAIGPPSKNPRYVFREEARPSTKEAASLFLIKKVERQDAALFTCHASNSYGTDNLNIKLIVQEPPEPPTILKASDVKSRSFKLSWTPSVGTSNAASKYHVECTSDTGKSLNTSVEGTKTLASVGPLRPAFTYRCHVRAENDIGIGDPSKDLEVTTAIEVPGGPPLEVRAVAVDSQTIRVTWKPPERELWHGELKGYYVGYRLDQPGDPYLYKTLQLDQHQDDLAKVVRTEVLLSPLRKFSPYLVLVQAFNAAGPGPRSDEVLVSTLDDAHVDGFVLKVVSKTATSLQMTASGSAVDDQVIQVLEVHLKSENGEWQQRSLAGRQNDTYHLDGLQCGTRYQLYAVAFLASGRREQSDLLALSTIGSPPVAPNKEDIVRTLNSSHVQVVPSAWRSGGCPLMRLSIEYRLLHGEQPQWIAHWNHTSPAAGVLPQDLPDVTIGSLEPETGYVVRLMAANAAGLTKVKYDVKLSSAHADGAGKGKTAVAAFLEDTTTLVSMTSSGVVLLAGLVAVICLVLYKRRRNGRAAAAASSGAKKKNTCQQATSSSSQPCTSSAQQQQPVQPKPTESRSSDLATATTTTTISTNDGGNDRAGDSRLERSGVAAVDRRASGGGGSSSVPPALPQKKNKEGARRSREQLAGAARSSPVRKSQSVATSKASSNAGSQQLLSQQQQQQPPQHKLQYQKNKQVNKPASKPAKQEEQERTLRIELSPTNKQFFDEEITPYATFQLSPTKCNIDDDGEEFKTFTIHHGEPPYLAKGSLDAPSTYSKNEKDEFYSHGHAANSHSLTSGSSNQDELLRAYEYARRHPPSSSQQASTSGALTHYDAPDDSHTTGSEGSTDPGIRQFTESPPEPNERRQAACITPGSRGGLSKESSSTSSNSSNSAGCLGPDGGADDVTPVNTPSQSSAIPACFVVWERAPLPGRSALVTRAGNLPQVKIPNQNKAQSSKSHQPLPPPPLPMKKGSVLSASTPVPTVVSSTPQARFVKKGLSSDESDESEGTASTFGQADVVRGSSSNEFSETDRSSQGAFGRRRKSGSDIIDC
ncbi:cell adhesion molecule Dscam1-like isoform X7 [Rhipicephalus microplus]|uniref:cell adhesion molecule Dscam1-like isoform X7 n=1 Tax=Rhipicephalus microplus TaxID=6941 RepID=UPI003F6A96AA